jgi:hypothetical protein
MATILPHIAVAEDRAGNAQGLRNWFLCWILLPNIGYWGLWIVGGPPRSLPVLIGGLAGIIAHRAPFAIRFALFLAVMVFSALTFISSLFNLSLRSLVHAMRFASELNPVASLEYLVCAIAVLATAAAAWWLLRRPSVLHKPLHIVASVAVSCGAMYVDMAMAARNGGHYHRMPEAGAPFASAVQDSGLDRIATGERHVMMVVVESMGQPVDPRVRQQLVDIWARPEIRARYEVSSGQTLFYGSTTNGEMRELCGRWAEYDEVMTRRDAGCLPARLAARGYHSQAWHSFEGSFFERTSWYPNVGFNEMRFGPELVGAGAEVCPGVFPGACDRDIPRQIGRTLREARSPQFLYWLTVNSHLPVIRDEQLGTEDCRRFDRRLAEEYPMTCRLLQLFDQTGRALAAEITAEGFPATDILIVGDHIPPFFDRHHRSQFAPDSVPWILLRPKVGAAQSPLRR